MKDERMQCATTILRQLGSNQFAVMTGAFNFIAHENGLSFHLPRNDFNPKRIKFVKVTLNVWDLYDVEFGRERRVNGSPEYELIAREVNIYADDLPECFTRQTGLLTSLRRAS